MGFATAIKRFIDHQGARAEDAERNGEDPRIQLIQASKAAQEKHRTVVQHASNVIAAKTRTEQKVNELTAEMDHMTKTMEAALRQQDEAEKAGDPVLAEVKAGVALSCSESLSALEGRLAGLQQSYETATKNAEEARKAVKVSEANIREKLDRITSDRTSLDQAKLQEELSAEFASMNSAIADDSVSLDEVHERIQTRLAAAGAQSEIAGTSEHVKRFDVEQSVRASEAQDRLAKKRAEMGLGEKAKVE